MSSMISRPVAASALVLWSVGGGTLSVSRLTAMNSADAMRRGLPSTVRAKSVAARSATGRPSRSTTLTSTGTRSTDERKVVGGCCGGGCGGCDCCGGAADSIGRRASGPVPRSATTVTETSAAARATARDFITAQSTPDRPSGSALAAGEPIALAGPDLDVFSGDFDRDPMPLAVSHTLGRGIGKQILVPEIVEDLREHGVELRCVICDERAPAADIGEPFEQPLQLARLDRPAVADRVDRRVAPFGLCDRGLQRRVAGLIVAIREQQDGPPS